MHDFDVIIIGGGPAGSACARTLSAGGRKVAVLDRAHFPRVKLCAGWLSAPVWDALGCTPGAYPGKVWSWNHCHVHYHGHCHTIRAQGHFIRRIEFDDWLLRTSGAQVFETSAKTFQRDNGYWHVNGKFRARSLVGAGGTNCPVARALFPKKLRRPVGAQEHEFQTSSADIARTRAGADGEPELLLHDDFSGYAWNVPKTDWLNVGCGTVNPKKVHAGWKSARDYFESRAHLPSAAASELDRAKGHAYYLYDPSNLEGCQHHNAFSIGDSLGLAQPLTAEGILPAILSGTICAEAILQGRPEQYRTRLESNPTIRDYALIYHLRERGAAASGSAIARQLPTPKFVRRLGNKAVATGFAWMFSGRPLPARRFHPLLRRL